MKSTKFNPQSDGLGKGKKTVPFENVERTLCVWSIQEVWLIYAELESDSEKAMAPHSSTLAWKIPWTEEPGGLQPMGSLRVGHN